MQQENYDLEENFGKLRKILRNNFRNMQTSRIELKKGLNEKKCNNVNDINLEKNVYIVTFPKGERILFFPSVIIASNGAAITPTNARDLYGSEEFELYFTYAALTNDTTALFNLLERYAKNNTVNKQHLRENLYRKAVATNAYQPVEQNYNMDNSFQSAVDNYNNSSDARRFDIHNYTCGVKNHTFDSENNLCVGKPLKHNSCSCCPQVQYQEYEYEPQSGFIDNSSIVGRALSLEDLYNRRYTGNCYNKNCRRSVYKKALYFIQDGNDLIPVFPA